MTSASSKGGRRTSVSILAIRASVYGCGPVGIQEDDEADGTRGRDTGGPRQLFAAADRVLVRDGPAGLTTRTVTAEAGVANGVLHRHFRDLDEFLASFVAGERQAVADGTGCPPWAAPGRAASPATSPRRPWRFSALTPRR